MSDNDLLNQFLNLSPRDVKNRAGRVFLTSDYFTTRPEACAACGADAVTFSAMAGISIGLCEQHKDASIGIGGGQPVMVVIDENTTIEAKGGYQ